MSSDSGETNQALQKNSEDTHKYLLDLKSKIEEAEKVIDREFANIKPPYKFDNVYQRYKHLEDSGVREIGQNIMRFDAYIIAVMNWLHKQGLWSKKDNARLAKLYKRHENKYIWQHETYPRNEPYYKKQSAVYKDKIDYHDYPDSHGMFQEYASKYYKALNDLAILSLSKSSESIDKNTDQNENIKLKIDWLKALKEADQTLLNAQDQEMLKLFEDNPNNWVVHEYLNERYAHFKEIVKEKADVTEKNIIPNKKNKISIEAGFIAIDPKLLDQAFILNLGNLEKQQQMLTQYKMSSSQSTNLPKPTAGVQRQSEQVTEKDRSTQDPSPQKNKRTPNPK